MSTKLEREYQAGLIKRIEERFPGCKIFKNDANQLQGIPDLLILYRDQWAMLEVKRSANARHRPNQDYYVEQFGQMSFVAFIYPENEQDVLHDLEQSLQRRRTACVPQR